MDINTVWFSDKSRENRGSDAVIANMGGITENKYKIL